MINKIQNSPHQTTMPAFRNKTKTSFGEGFYFLEKSKKVPLKVFQEQDFLDDLFARISKGEFRFSHNEKSSAVYLSEQNDRLIVNNDTDSSIEFNPCAEDVIAGLNVEILPENMTEYASKVYNNLLGALERLLPKK